MEILKMSNACDTDGVVSIPFLPGSITLHIDN